jgi:long-subunit fatty acid transport protein
MIWRIGKMVLQTCTIVRKILMASKVIVNKKILCQEISIMRKTLTAILTAFLIAFAASISLGASLGQGARAIGMGGAYTAVADDNYAPYWNPAGMTQIKHFGLTLGVGAQGDLDKMKNVKDALDDNIMPAQDDLNQSVQLATLLGFTTKHFGINDYLDFDLTTKMDDQNTNINTTAVDYGLVTVAFHITEGLAFGINLKAVAAGCAEVNSPTIPDTSNYSKTNPTQWIQEISDFNSTGAIVSYNSGTGTACDIGILYQLTSKVNIGFTARNAFYQIDPDEGTESIYKVQLDTTDSGYALGYYKSSSTTKNLAVEIPQSYILGLAYHPFKSTLLSLDVENITNTSNDQTRIHFGLEQTALWNTIAIRLGCFTTKDEPISYTAGFGLRLLWIFNTNVAVVKSENNNAAIITEEISF